MHVTFSRTIFLLRAMLRVRTAFLLLLFIAIADTATKTSADVYSPLLAFVVLAVAAWYIFSTSINDIADEAIDKINLQGNPDRPLITKAATTRDLYTLAAISGFSTIMASIPLGLVGVLSSAGALILSYCYSMPPVRISYRGVLAPLLLPLGYIVFPFTLTTAANDFSLDFSTTLLIAILYVSFVARIVLKDFRDVAGDAKFGKRTFIVRYGSVATVTFSAAAWAIAFGLIVWRFWELPLVWGLILPFVLAIVRCLRLLGREPALRRQVQFVGLIGRLANGSALLLLAALYREISPENGFLYGVLLCGLALFSANAAYVLYRPLLTADK
jgi:4-hydroxybenzoate polyprenyltransferase